MLVNAYPPNKLPHIPPIAIANQDSDWRSPVNAALSNLTASAIIASTTTSAMAEPRFCTVKEIMRCTLESIRGAFRPKTSHGKRENIDATTKYGILFLPPIGIQSDKIPYNGFMLHGKIAIEYTN